jgi:3',5'-cyclic AMP phosphodiesterase CpdA
MKKNSKRILVLAFPVLAVAGALCLILLKRPSYDITFFLTSDLHYGLSATVAAANEATIDAMNFLPGTVYPEGIGGKVMAPRGVVVLGDLTNDGSGPEASGSWRAFAKDYGVSGEGRLKFPAYEGAGNHDGGEGEVVRRGIRDRNKLRPGLKSVSPNGVNYSWDWDKVHFVHLGLFTGSGGDDIVNQWGTDFTGTWRLPGHSLEFLKDDLAKNVGKGGRPVVLFQHYGWDEWGLGWWSEDERRAFQEAIKGYNVIGVFWGHTHVFQSMNWGTVPTWCVGTGQRDPEPGEFVAVRIRPKEVSVVERKAGGQGSWGRWTRVLINTRCPEVPRGHFPF